MKKYWRSSFTHPPRKGWYECKPRDNRWGKGVTQFRAWGNGSWWIPLKDGWLSSPMGLYQWRPPAYPISLDYNQLPPVIAQSFVKACAKQSPEWWLKFLPAERKTPMKPEVPEGYIKQRLVVCAAIRSKSTGAIICGVRHYDGLMHAQIKASGGREALGPVEQGFVDQKGVFLSRQEAWQIAKSAKQIRHWIDMGDGTLYSENLY